MRRFFPVLSLTLACHACGGSPGQVVGGEATAAFVDEPVELVLQDHTQGVVRVRLDGAASRRLFATFARIADVTDDAATFLFVDSETRLQVGLAATGVRLPIAGAGDRVSSAVLSPDGRWLLASRHADFDLPQALWEDDDQLVLHDLDLGTTRVIPATRTETPRVAFAKDGARAFARYRDFDDEISLPEGVRRRRAERVSEDALRPPPVNRGGPVCEEQGLRLVPVGFGGDEGLDLVDAEGVRRRLVEVRGRERGFHDYLDTIGSPQFSPSCAYVTFEFGDSVWVASVASGRVAPVHRGSGAFFVE